VIATLATIAVALSFALSLLVAPPAQAQAINAGSQPFANPNEVRYGKDSKLRMIMQIVSGQFKIPSVGTETMRQFRGWDAAGTMPAIDPNVSPGPTLRARLGGQVQISFLNKIDDSLFPYSFVTDSQPGVSDFGCDKSGTRDPKTGIILPYPGNDKFPNCFHGSSTANLHFHGTHTSPDGLSDNVLVQVMPQLIQQDWTNTFNRIFAGKIPQKWTDMPAEFQKIQKALIKKLDIDAADAARKNGLRPPDSLSANNDKTIASGQWPQYIMGAFPNFFDIPDYDKASGAFNSGGNGYKAGQAPGTHWYHAHKHGSTSLHIRNGLAGALIIESSHEGGYDHFIRKFYNWGETYGVHEKIFVFQQFDPIQNLERSPKLADGSGAASQGKAQTLVNGKLTPTITMQPGEVQLWRLINATQGNGPGIIQKNLFLASGFTFKQTAMDGVQFSPANYANQPFLTTNAPAGLVRAGLVLAAGNRADLLVQAPTTPGIVAFRSGGRILFFVNVVGTPVTFPNGAFPPATWTPMPAFLKDLSKPGPNDVVNKNSPVKFQWEDGRHQTGLLPATPDGFPPHFMINDKQFGEAGDVIDQCMPLDGLQDWILENYTTLAHPFHIHINPFQVIQIDTPAANADKTKYPTYSSYAPAGDFIWQDVIAIPPGVIAPDGKTISPGRIKIRQAYLDFTGTYVLHCHILAHEDRGMMQLVRVVPAANYPGGCQNTVPAHH